LEAVRNLQVDRQIDLIIAPASDPLGMPRFSNKRCRFIRECGVPVWTIGSAVQVAKLSEPTRNVACWVDLQSADKTHIKLAFEYAWKLDAKLHLLHALPQIDEGTLARPLHYDKPLYPGGAAEEIRQLLGWLPITPEIHVAPGGAPQAVRRLVRECEANILFLGTGQAIQTGWLGARLNPAIDKCPCPVVCVDTRNASVPVWKLERGSVFQSVMRVPQAVPVRASVGR
jgi:hypothetical protein